MLGEGSRAQGLSAEDLGGVVLGAHLLTPDDALYFVLGIDDEGADHTWCGSSHDSSPSHG